MCGRRCRDFRDVVLPNSFHMASRTVSGTRDAAAPLHPYLRLCVIANSTQVAQPVRQTSRPGSARFASGRFGCGCGIADRPRFCTAIGRGRVRRSIRQTACSREGRPPGLTTRQGSAGIWPELALSNPARRFSPFHGSHSLPAFRRSAKRQCHGDRRARSLKPADGCPGGIRLDALDAANKVWPRLTRLHGGDWMAACDLRALVIAFTFVNRMLSPHYREENQPRIKLSRRLKHPDFSVCSVAGRR
jgi:hypothetical protein